MSLINIANLTFAYDGSYDNVFTDTSFQIDTDWKLGFCGRNGRGKTTFLKLLMGQYEYSGAITASVDFVYFPFVVEDGEAHTLDVIMGVAPDAQIWQIQKELSKLAVDEETLYRPYATLSGGEQTKTLLAGLFLRENAFLLIDEPTDHLDMAARETVARYLNGKSGFILVSHDRRFLDGCVDHILSINKANIEIQKGDFTSWHHNRQLQDEYEAAENDKLKKDIKRLESAARQSGQWADTVESAKMGKGAAKARKRGHMGMDTMAYYGEKSRRMQQRRKNLERRQQSAIEEKSGLLKNVETSVALKIHPLAYHAERLLSLDAVSIAYDGREIVRGLGFTLEGGDRLALMGGNGTGKSSVLKLLVGQAGATTQAMSNASAGATATVTGSVTIGSGLILSYVPQDASYLSGGLRAFARAEGIDETLFMTILRQLDFSRTQFEKDMEDYSAGQKKKVLIAASLSKQAHVYIWDEPLNYVDLLSRIQIEELIKRFRPTMLFAEHDRAFCEAVATRKIRLDTSSLSGDRVSG